MKTDGRKIIHVDMDCFYAAIEQRDNSELRGKPIAVGGSDNRRGVIATASYEARKYGIKSALATKFAKKKCPKLIIVPPRFSAYKEVSKTIREVFYKYTDLVEPLSLDEAYLDVTENKLDMKSAILVARRIKEDILKETELTASAGVSYNKFLAKVASDYNKPYGLTAILPQKALAFMQDLPVESFFGIGQATARKMHRLRIKNGGDLRAFSKLELATHFGRNGEFLYNICRGIDERPVNPDRVRKSISEERTFAEDLVLEKIIIEQLLKQADHVSELMKKHNIKGKTTNIKIRFKNFETVTRSHTLGFYTNEVEHIRIEAKKLYRAIENTREVRLIGVGMSNLDTELDGSQLELDLKPS